MIYISLMQITVFIRLNTWLTDLNAKGADEKQDRMVVMQRQSLNSNWLLAPKNWHYAAFHTENAFLIGGYPFLQAVVPAIVRKALKKTDITIIFLSALL